MTSKKPVDSNSSLLPMVKIKVEPGTSMASMSKDIKTEPGVQPSATRLTSFRVPRDLTLGANKKPEKPKKIYTPNINAQRNKKKEDGDPVKKETKPGRGKSRGRGQGDRGRGRGKAPSNLVQSTGVFSEGITESSRAGRRFSGYRDSEGGKDAKSFIEKPLLNLNQTIDKADEEEKIKTLLRDDFIDDGSDPILENAPISLPLFDEGKLYKSDTKTETKMQVAKEEEEIDVKPIILPNGEAVMPSKIARSKIPHVEQQARKTHDTIKQVFETSFQSNDFMLIQFPDRLPGLRTSDESTDHRPRKQNEQNPPPPPDSAGKSDFCKLASLNSGLLGKVQIYKSGEARLLVGENAMIIDVGSKPTFRQDLVTTKINADNTSAELVNLGRVNNTLICSPDWETMLASL